MRLLYLDCPSGIAGDMLLAALIDLGADVSYIMENLQAMGLEEEWTLRFIDTTSNGIRAKRAIVTVRGQLADSMGENAHAHSHAHPHFHSSNGHDDRDGHQDHHHKHHQPGRQGQDHHSDHKYAEHEHDEHHHSPHDLHHHHEHDDHHHRPYRAIKQMIEGARLQDRVKERALKVFRELAHAEGAVHGVEPEQVHFHEVGSTDAIIDIVGCALALESLGIEAIEASPLHVGRGFVRAAHGRLPVPAPATLRLLEGISVYQTDVTGELVTPTGAALVKALCGRVGPMPLMRIERIGHGAGSMQLSVPNILRAVLGRPLPTVSGKSSESSPRDIGEHLTPSDLDRDDVIEIVTNIDDMSPQLFGAVFDALFEAGALDVWVTPSVMKKGRPGHILHVLVWPDPVERTIERIVDLILRETTSLGVRMRAWTRRMLRREWITVETTFGPVRVKLGIRKDQVVNIAPEYDDCLAAAHRAGVPVKSVITEALTHAARSRSVSSSPDTPV